MSNTMGELNALECPNCGNKELCKPNAAPDPEPGTVWDKLWCPECGLPLHVVLVEDDGVRENALSDIARRL